MWDVFFSFFVITALALLFAHAWNLFAETLIDTWDIKDKDGNVKAPVLQTFVYAVIVTLLSIGVIWYVHNHTNIDMEAGRALKHRDPDVGKSQEVDNNGTPPVEMREQPSSSGDSTPEMSLQQ